MDIKVHALWHMPDKILDTGPLWATAMWVYEGIWSKLVDWATNEAAPELTLLRSFCDYEVASFAYWRDPEGFSVPAVTRFTVEYAQEAALRYSVPRDPVQERLITESLGGVRLNKPGHRFDPNIRLALHYYYMDYEPRYSAMFEQYLLTWFSNLTAGQKQRLRVKKVAGGELSYGLPALNDALNGWSHWATQQRAAARHSGAAVSSSMHSQVHWSGVITQPIVSLYSEMQVNQHRVVDKQHNRAAEFGWVLLRQWDDAEHMCFMHVVSILVHLDGTNRSRTLLYGQLYSSKSASGGIDIDPFIGMPVFSKQADKGPGGSTYACVASHQVATSNVCVVELQNRHGKLVALSRDPQRPFLDAGYPLPE